jgi:hypothetical protein
LKQIILYIIIILEKLLSSNGHYSFVTEIDLWSDNLKENLNEAMTKKRLNDFLVSLAPKISIESVNNNNINDKFNLMLIYLK